VSIEFVLTTAPTDDVRALIAELETFLHAPGHDPRQHHGYSIEKIFQPRMRFFAGYSGAQAVACGGIELQDGTAELKRMYIRPAFRGGDASRLLIARLEHEARANGAGLVRLETGDWLVRAQAFYAREGYRVCGAFPPYSELPAFNIAHSVFMEKRLG
jgi:putative acetyltransferase